MNRLKKIGVILAGLLLIAATIDAGNARGRAHETKQWITEDDVQAEIEVGREVAARIIGTYTLYKNDELTRYVNLVGKSLARSANRPELMFTFGVLDTPEINAFAAPGGYVFITKGAIDLMANEAELAGVLGHEIIHITQRHIVRELDIKATSKEASAGVGRLLGGSTDVVKVAFTKAVDQAVNILLERGYQKGDEFEADTLGTVLSASMNYDPHALSGYLDRIAKAKEAETATLKKLHPGFDERSQRINNTITKEGLEGGKYADWKIRFEKYAKRKG